MAASTRDLILRYQADTTDLRNETSKAQRTASGMANNVGAATTKGAGKFRRGLGAMAGAAAKLAGPIAAVFAVDKIKDFAVASVNAASDLNETLSKSAVIFGKQAGAMEKWAEGGATAFGLSKEAALGAAAGFGDMLSQIGFTGKEAANASKSVVQMAADLGSFNNLETGEVLDMISASLRGEYDSLQRVIPNINAARVEKEALAATGKENAKALTAEEKAAATLAIIQKDGARAQGDFARTSGGLANQQKILKAQFDNLKATLGQALLPIITKVAQALNKVLGPASKAVASGIDTMSTAISGFWTLLTKGDFDGQLHDAFGWYEDNEAITWVYDLRDAIKGTGSATSGMAKAMDGVKSAFAAVGAAGKKLWEAIAPIVKQIGGKLFSSLMRNMPEIKAMATELVQALGTYFQFLALYFSKIAAVVKKVWSVIGPTVLKILGNVIDAVVGILGGAIKIISGILDIIVGIFTGDFSKIKRGVTKIVSGLVKIVGSLIKLMFRNMKAILEPLVKWVVRKFQELKAKVTKAFQSLLSWIKTTWKSGWSKLRGYLTAPIIWAKSKIDETIKKIRGAFNKVKSWASTTWKNGWKKFRGWIADPIKRGREDTAGALNKVKDKFRSIKDWGKSTWKASWAKAEDWILNPIKKARDTIAKIFGKEGPVRGVFKKFVSGVGVIFDGMKKAIGKPLNKVIDFINKGLIKGGINKILNALGVPKGEQIPWISPVSYEMGGPVVGGTPWQRAGRDRYPARLDRDEHVLTRGEVRKLGGHRRILQWRKAVRQGKAYDYPPGLAAGGTVRPVPGGFGTFPSYPGHTGVDFPVGTGTPVHAVAAGVIKAVRALTYSYGKHIIQSVPGGMEALYAHLNSFATRQGASVGAGQVIGYTDSTGNSTGPHLHFTLQHPGGRYVDPTSFLNSGKLPGGTSVGGGAITDMIGFLKGLSPVKWLTDKASGMKDSILGFLGRNPWAKGLARVPGLIMKKAGSFMQDKLFGGLFAPGDPGGSGVQRWRSTIVAALKANNLPTTDAYVNAWLRQVESESGGNPRAVQNGYVDVNTISGDLAKGLLQTISATFNAYKFDGHGDIFNGFDNALAAINYAKNRYGSKGMLGVIGHGHGYDSGGWLPTGMSLAVNNTGRPEPVLTGQQWDAVTGAGQQPIHVEVVFNAPQDRAAVAREIERLLIDLDRSRGGPNLISRSRKVVRNS